MKTTLFLLIFSFSGTAMLAQSETATCDCSQNLNQTIEKVETNYAGYPAKLKAEGKMKYRQLVDSLQKMSEGISDPMPCFYIITRFVNFFEDTHLGFNFVGSEAVDTTRIKISADQIKEKLKNTPPSFIEGVWEKADSSLTIAIVPDTSNLGHYHGIVLQSNRPDISQELVYFRLQPSTFGYKVNYYNRFYSGASIGKQRDNLLQIGTSELWLRTFPYNLTEKEYQAVQEWKKYDKGLRFNQITSDFAYLKIPTFTRTDSQIEELVTNNDSLIRRTPNLIIDLRGNDGGQNGWIHFLPYLYTQPIFQGYSYYRMSEDNKPEVLGLLDMLANQPLPEDIKAYFNEDDIQVKKREFADFKHFEGKFFPMAGATFRFDSVLTYPEKVAVIVDEQGGSSTEFFMNLCQQSDKTTTFGRNTFGMMDYQGASSPTPLPYSNYYLYIPISKSDWTDTDPKNETGFEPEVIIPTSVPADKWVDFVTRSLELP
ncbi:MAG: S41 family peptidase [Bacteroidota bacterium]